jgi:hypothetical protein
MLHARNGCIKELNVDRYIVQLTKKNLLHVQSSMIHKLYYLGLCSFKSFILFILLDHAFSIRTRFSRTNTFEIHSISTSKYLIHLITDDIKNYCIFGTSVPLLNVSLLFLYNDKHLTPQHPCETTFSLNLKLSTI